MKKISLLFSILLLLGACSKYEQDTPIETCNTGVPISAYSKSDTLTRILNRYSRKGIPGLVIATYSPEGWWGHAAGYAKIETKQPMQLCHLQYLQSVSKTFMAVAILRLYEQGRIDLDAPITTYLPQKFSKYIDRAPEISVRHLLNHRSGITDYNTQPEYVAYLLQHPEETLHTEDYLGYIEGKDRQFTPGAKFEYGNINYLLLALIADEVAGDHAQLLKQSVQPAALQHTFYRGDAGYLSYPTLTNSYWDRFSNGVIENVSIMQRVNVASLIGDDGVVATPFDAVKFLKALQEGQLLQPATMQLMKTWVNDENGKPKYGMGLYHIEHAGKQGWGHGGAGIGSGCALYYFPATQTYVFLGTNIGTLVEGPIVEEVGHLRDEILDVIVKN